MTKQSRRANKKLLKEVRALQRTGSADVVTALKLLAEEAAPDPASMPTRQQRRKAEREAQKRSAR